MNHFISLTEAETMTQRFRGNREAVLSGPYQNQNILPVCETFDKQAFAILLQKAECAGIRIYYGMDELYKVHAIIVACDVNGNDILPSGGLTAAEDEDIVERGNRCPDLCPPSSPLNS
jgi:hypothetical protein